MTSLQLRDLILSLFVASCFLSYSVLTPLGYLSLSDVVLGLGCALLACEVLYHRRLLPMPQGSIVALCLLCLALVATSTLVLQTGLSVTPLVKYAVFLLLLPLTLWLARAAGPINPEALLATLALCGNLFLAWLVISLANGRAEAQQHAVSIFGSPIYKNQLGHYLAIIATANLGLWTIKGGALRLILMATAMGASLALDVRGPILAVLIIAPFLWFDSLGLSRLAARRLIALLALGAGFLAVILALGAFGPQLARFLEGSATEVTSTASRNLLWRAAFQQIAQNPWFGLGQGGFLYSEPESWMDGQTQPHNNLLQITVEGGILGLLAFMTLTLCCLWPQAAEVPARRILRYIAVVYLVTTLVDIVWVRGTGHLFWLLAFTLAMKPQKSDRPSPT